MSCVCCMQLRQKGAVLKIRDFLNLPNCILLSNAARVNELNIDILKLEWLYLDSESVYLLFLEIPKRITWMSSK